MLLSFFPSVMIVLSPGWISHSDHYIFSNCALQLCIFHIWNPFYISSRRNQPLCDPKFVSDISKANRRRGKLLLLHFADPHVNGLLTLGENMADNGGMREAWFAYLNYIDRNGTESNLPGLDFLTPEQLVFITFSYVRSQMLPVMWFFRPSL